MVHLLRHLDVAGITFLGVAAEGNGLHLVYDVPGGFYDLMPAGGDYALVRWEGDDDNQQCVGVQTFPTFEMALLRLLVRVGQGETMEMVGPPVPEENFPERAEGFDDFAREECATVGIFQ